MVYFFNGVFALFLHQMTPLHMATEGGHTEIVKYLVGDLGADFKRKIKDGVMHQLY